MIKSTITSLFFMTSMLFTAQAQVNHVVIAALYGGGSNAGALYTNDFIELYNPTGNPISLANYSVQYAGATSYTWQAQPINNTIPAGGFLLIQLAGNGTVGVPLPNADVIGSMNLSATTGKVALVDTVNTLFGSGMGDSTVIDLVGYGPTASGYETNPGPALTSKKCLVRISGACSTSGDNSVDFIASNSFVPQNAASPVSFCGGLPVSLVSFTALWSNKGTLLDWKTNLEDNLNCFVVEKSNNAIDFFPIATVLAKKLNTGSNYSYSDTSTTLKKAYYRLKIIDNDAGNVYSALVVMKGGSIVTNKITLSPNPVINTLTVVHAKAVVGAKITITSANGKIVALQKVAIGSTQTSINTSGFAKASYFVSYRNNGINTVEAFVK